MELSFCFRLVGLPISAVFQTGVGGLPHAAKKLDGAWGTHLRLDLGAVLAARKFVADPSNGVLGLPLYHSQTVWDVLLEQAELWLGSQLGLRSGLGNEVPSCLQLVGLPQKCFGHGEGHR